jgi:SPP1 family predicted phage head-tail adaptor
MRQLSVGSLRHRITIEKPTETRSKSGAITLSWETAATVWAEKQDLSGREYLQAQQAESLISTRFRIHYRSDITAKMRVKHGNNYYSIEAVLDPDGFRRELHLMCKAVPEHEN